MQKVIHIKRYIEFSQEQAASDLFICQFGEDECPPAYAFGPHVRNHVLIHFVTSGCGVFQCSDRTYPIQAGQGFLILPGEETFYQADSSSPWHYAWVGYRGNRAESLTRAAGLDEHHRIFTPQNPSLVWQAMADMRREGQALRLSQLSAAGNLLRFLSLIAPLQDPISSVSPARQYCEKAQWYLEGRYDRDISIQETADYVGLSRSHLYRLMMEEYGCSPKDLLLRIRMRHAAQLLRTTTLTLEEIAHRIGLQTGAQLGAAFRSMYGHSPGKHRRMQESIHAPDAPPSQR